MANILRNIGRSPRDTLRTRRALQRLKLDEFEIATTGAIRLVDGTLSLVVASGEPFSDATGGLTLVLAATNPGLQLVGGGLGVLVQGVLSVDASGIRLDIGAGLENDGAGNLRIADAAITLPRLAALTTKGDVLGHSGTDHVRVAVGADGLVLTADAAQGSGLAWADPLAALVYDETPAGTIDGVNDEFTLANTPVAGSVRLYKNGIRQRVGGGNDYTISGGTITYEAGSIPSGSDWHVADYVEG